MATRPAVLVFQEFATLSTNPASPELNCLIAGPAYHIQSFPEDSISAVESLVTNKVTSGTYGTLVPPAATGDSAAPEAGTVALAVAEVPGNKNGAVLDRDSVRVFLGAVRLEVLNAVCSIELNAQADITPRVTISGVTAAELAAALGKSPKGAGVTAVLSNGQVLDVLSYADLVVTLSAAPTDEVEFVRFEKPYSADVDSNYAAVAADLVAAPGGNAVNVRGGVTVAGLPVVYGEAYVAYRALRTDLDKVTVLSSESDITSKLGRIDAQNPLAVGASIALKNTTGTVQVWGVDADSAAGYERMQGGVSGRKDVYAVVPLTNDLQVLAALKGEFEGLADPLLAQQNGVPQKFRVVIGSAGPLPLQETVSAESTTGQSRQVADTAPGGLDTKVLLSATGINLVTSGVVPGCRVTLTKGALERTYTVATVLTNTSFVVDQPVAAIPGGLAVADVTVAFTKANGDPLVSEAVTVTVAAREDLYLELYDAAATFVSKNVNAGDFVKIGASLFEVKEVRSNQELRVVNNGGDTSLVQNELPHGALAAETITYSIVRDLDRAGQVEALKAKAASLKSKRAVLCWPDAVTIAGLPDFTGTRAPLNQTAPAAAAQPGYYLACAVGGLVSALPPQHGFTNLAVAGITSIKNASDYFTDKQITDISNGGWLVFQQDSESALPYCVHQMTTDPSAVELSELSMVKNFDYVSLFFSDILNDYIGTWNINQETMAFIDSALQTGIQSLRLRKQPRIGAPIIDARITQLKESPVSSDRLEIFVEVDFPRPLNTIALHLVSI